MQGIERLLVRFDRAARASGVPYAYMGAIAVMAWGQPRATNDIDVLIQLGREQVPGFARAVTAEGFDVSARDLESAFMDRSHVSMFDDETGFRFDLKLALNRAEQEEVQGAASVPFQGAEISVVRPEDTIAFKLMFGSPLDRQDARSVLARQEGRLDMERLRALAHRLGVAAGLDRMLSGDEEE